MFLIKPKLIAKLTLLSREKEFGILIGSKMFAKDLESLVQLCIESLKDHAMIDTFEGRTYDTGVDRTCVLQLQTDFDSLRPHQRAMLKKIATECNEYGHSISLDQLKSHRRYQIGRGLVDLIMSDNCDELLITSLCHSIQGVLFKTAGGAIGHLDASCAEQFAVMCRAIRWDEQDIVWNTSTDSFGFPSKEKVGK